MAMDGTRLATCLTTMAISSSTSCKVGSKGMNAVLIASGSGSEVERSAHRRLSRGQGRRGLERVSRGQGHGRRAPWHDPRDHECHMVRTATSLMHQASGVYVIASSSARSSAMDMLVLWQLRDTLGFEMRGCGEPCKERSCEDARPQASPRGSGHVDLGRDGMFVCERLFDVRGYEHWAASGFGRCSEV